MTQDTVTLRNNGLFRLISGPDGREIQRFNRWDREWVTQNTFSTEDSKLARETYFAIIADDDEYEDEDE